MKIGSETAENGHPKGLTSAPRKGLNGDRQHAAVESSLPHDVFASAFGIRDTF